MRELTITVMACSLFFVVGKAAEEAPAPRPAAAPSVESPFTKDLLKIGAEYSNWGYVDDETRWAPYLCRQPMPAIARVSASKDDDTHGQKLYSLLAKDRARYMTLGKNPDSLVGQVVVKESWVPVELTEKPDRKEILKQLKHTGPIYFDSARSPFARKGEKWFKTGKPAGLFVMMKLDPKTAGTDKGWVYATLSADGRTVTAAGRIESCMKCHQDAKSDRLFGLAAATYLFP